MVRPNSPQLKSEANSSIYSRVSPWLALILYPLGCYLVMPLFFGKIEIIGQENIPQTAPVVVAPTHRSRWDALIVPYAVGRFASGRDLRFMVSVNEVKGLQGWFIRRMGGFSVDPDRPSIDSLRHSIELLSEGEMLVIFPEGYPEENLLYLFKNNQIHPLKRGVARIALGVASQEPDCGIKILPVSIKYSQPHPSWGTKVKVKIGRPIEVADYLSDSLRKSSQKLTAALKFTLQELHEEQRAPIVVS